MPTKYTIVEGKNSAAAAIRIDEGKYKDVILNYGKVGFDEREGECRLYFDYFVLENEEAVEDNDDFKEVIGDILVELLENHLEEGGFDGDNGNHHLEESDSE
tara:strand:- start:3669 stop:3974 length:306 start_codon:yes stop_codon:yes gene_type:complete